jgi:hypothetical protein
LAGQLPAALDDGAAHRHYHTENQNDTNHDQRDPQAAPAR